MVTHKHNRIRHPQKTSGSGSASPAPPVHIPAAARTDQVDAPCGCSFWTEADAFVIKPCSPSCEVYQYAVGQTMLQHKPMEIHREA